ncbi:DUF1659 domain-containing protein [Sporosarcina obsidiansis]|uniref:DUF1659 domain-containing protein n=1 Tax=Sporosarcina obsidiansis TaxID=2660748 RepID=UPI00129BAD5A|nr:DUF1659 domain-containing protein [Sporosarcina obsidiansis]
MAASLEFNQAAGKIHFNAGTNEKGNIIRKVKTYQNITRQSSAANLHVAFTQLASLSSYLMIKAEKVVTEDIQND